MKRLILSILCLICFNSAYSCINEFNINSKGDTTQVEDYAIIHFYNQHFDKKETEKWLSNYNLNDIPSYKPEEQSDIGVQLLKLGEFEAALKIFERLVKENPSKYEFNSNLGTTYELLGKNEFALKYIKKGLEINPYSHNNSEWIHVKILEAKLALAKNPNWLKTNKILDLSEKMPSKPSIDTGYAMIDFENSLSNLEYQLANQLETRLPFTPSPDLFMALLYEELATFTAKQISTSRAHGYASLAKYFAPNEEMQTKLGLLIDEYKILTEEYYNGVFKTDELPNLEEYLDTSKFYLGENGVHWLKISETNENSVIDIALNNSKKSWLIPFLGIAIIGFFLWRMVIRNSKELDNLE